MAKIPTKAGRLGLFPRPLGDPLIEREYFSMKRSFKPIVSTIIICCMIFVLFSSALAAQMSLADDAVNFRAAPSLDSEVLAALDAGVKLEVLEHDPAGWSKVKYNGMIGYVKSDFLTIPTGSGSVVFKTTDVVNFRSGPSLDDEVITSLSEGTVVEVLEHSPTGWSKIKAEGLTGYVRSDFLTIAAATATTAATAATAAAAMSSESSSGGSILRTNDGVNMRSGPSTSDTVIKTLDTNTEVEVLERNVDGWSKVRHDSSVGFIRADLLSVNGMYVELLDWSVVRNMIQYNTVIRVYDVRTGISFNIQCFSKGDHADVQPITRADTEAHSRTHNYVKSWNARPVWVTIGDRTVAASLHGMPHDVSWIPDNGMDGHVCLHFLGSTTSSSSAFYKQDLQNAVQEAWSSR